MAYRVDISVPALADAEDAYLWLKEHSPASAGNWYEGLLDAIFSLESFPTRCPVASESVEIGKEINQLLLSDKIPLNSIKSDIFERTVRILAD